MTTTAIEKPENLGDMLRDKVRQVMVESIPDETINAMVQKEWDSFFVVPPKSNHYNARAPKSKFETMISGIVQAKIEENMGGFIDKQLEKVADRTGQYADPWVLKPEVVEALVPMVFEGWMKQRLSESLHAISETMRGNNGF
jgi:hypothetical protein